MLNANAALASKQNELENELIAKLGRKSLRIGVFYDGGFFQHISNYYRYAHPRHQRISIPGLHEFIRVHAAEEEGVDPKYSHIVDAHFFRGRFSAQQSLQREKLYTERLFDDVLMNENITTHYRPIQNAQETGIDVCLSLEAYDLAIHHNYDVVVLIAGNSDYVSLVMKLNEMGIRVMLLGWNFEYTDDFGVTRQTTTSSRLISEVTYPVAMHDIMNYSAEDEIADPVIKQLFVEPGPRYDDFNSDTDCCIGGDGDGDATGERPLLDGKIYSLKDGFGFIKCEAYPNNVFFHLSALNGCEFDSLKEEEEVVFMAENRGKGPIATKVIRKADYHEDEDADVAEEK